jgi:hypothetical protein
LQWVAATCPPNRQVASFVGNDGSGSSSSPAISKQRLAVIAKVVEKTVVCGGELRVVGFSNSSGSNVSIFDGQFPLPGATETARVRVAAPVIARSMKAISKAYGPAMASLPQTGSDIVAEYRLAAEFEEALGSSHYELNLVLQTDGLQNVGFNLEGSAISPAGAIALAKTIPMPNLSGASITVTGLGNLSGSPAPSTQVAGLVSFYAALCHQAHAAQCLSVTSLPAGW